MKRMNGVVAAVAVLTAIMLTLIPANAESGYVNTVSSGLNLRSGAGTGYPVLTSLPKGSAFEIISEADGWTYVSASGVTGWVSSGYVGRYISSRSALILPVPDYKQYDSRWSLIKLGSTGCTVKSIGCTATCVAITETKRTGQTVTPADIVRNFDFTYGGALYWTSDYSAYYGSSRMDYIYTALLSGRPVIVHSHNLSGGSHWIVVYGFTGGDIYDTTHYLIRDPASVYRTTLAQYLAVYPSVQKLVTYAYTG